MHRRRALIRREQRLVGMASLKAQLRVHDNIEETRAAARGKISTYFRGTLHVTEVGGGGCDLSSDCQ